MNKYISGDVMRLLLLLLSFVVFSLFLLVSYSARALSKGDRFIDKKPITEHVSNFSNRHYSNVLGRFLTLDSAKAMGSEYAYTHGSPIMEYDPSGLIPMLEGGEEYGAVAEASHSAVQSTSVSSSTKESTTPVHGDRSIDQSSHITPTEDKAVKNIVVYKAKIIGTNDFVTISYNVPPKYLSSDLDLEFSDESIEKNNISVPGVYNDVRSLFDMFNSKETEGAEYTSKIDDPDRESECTTYPCAKKPTMSSRLKSDKSLAEDASLDLSRGEYDYRKQRRIELNKRLDQRRIDMQNKYDGIIDTYKKLLNQ